MNIALNEVKTQAKKLLKALRSDQSIMTNMNIAFKKLNLSTVDQVKLKHCLSLISLQLGFDSWQQAQNVLSGNSNLEDHPNMGTFFYNNKCGALINEWFASYMEAETRLQSQPTKKFILPYKRQFILVERHFLEALNLSENGFEQLRKIEHDMMRGYNTPEWDIIALEIIKNRVKSY